jgi:hypothetical protein
MKNRKQGVHCTVYRERKKELLLEWRIKKDRDLGGEIDTKRKRECEIEREKKRRERKRLTVKRVYIIR